MANAEKPIDETAVQPRAVGAPVPSPTAAPAPHEDSDLEREAAADEALAAPSPLEPETPTVQSAPELTTDAAAGPAAELAASQSESDPEADAELESIAHAVPSAEIEPAVDAPPEPAPAVPGAEPGPGAQAAAEPTAPPTSLGAAEATAGAPAVAVTARAASAGRPIWSDHGDAPFDDSGAGKTGKMTKPGNKRSDDDGGGRSAGNETVEIFKTIVFALAIAFVLRVVLLQPFTIPSGSMEPNLYEGDYIVVSKWTYGYSKHSIPWSPPLFDGRILGKAPERGDIVVFKLPRDNRTDYIKRVIGLPGERIQMINNVLHINGQAVQDLVIARAEMDGIFGPQPVIRARETLPEGKSFIIQDFGPNGEADNTQVYEVPQGYYFLMGDNRDNSVDSRYSVSEGVGLVPEENLVGKAEIILFSWSPGASLWNPVSWFANLRPSRFFTVLN